MNFTDEGIRNVKDSPNRLEAFRSMAGKLGVTTKGAYYLMGQYDLLVMVEAPMRRLRRPCSRSTHSGA